jgi:phosphate transport system ATP-binding protein
MTMQGLSTQDQESRLSSPLGRNAVSARAQGAAPSGVVMECKIRKLYYGSFLAVRDTDIAISANEITALIGPSGCGKSTVLRCFNRMNDFVDGFHLEGGVQFQGEDIYAEQIDPVAVRRSIGMVFQQPNPFAMSIAKNVAFGLRLNRFKGNYAERIEQALRGAALWDEVKDKLNESGLSLSGGQQQRLCIARAIAVEPQLLLMDEPCSALDPIATRKVEELMLELKQRYTIAIVTHNLQQAQRVADRTAFLFVDTTAGGRTGYLIEHRPTAELFGDPKQERTKEYIRGEFS